MSVSFSGRIPLIERDRWIRTDVRIINERPHMREEDGWFYAEENEHLYFNLITKKMKLMKKEEVK